MAIDLVEKLDSKERIKAFHDKKVDPDSRIRTIFDHELKYHQW